MAEEKFPPQKSIDTFMLFPKLPTELQLKIWKAAVPDPRVMQIHSIYPASTRSPDLSLQQRCDAEATILGHEVEFGTDTIPSGLLRACKQSRDVLLKIYDGCIESGGRKIRFDKDKDIIFLHTISQCCERSLPGLHSRPETIPDYRKIFVDVQHLAMSGYGINSMQDCRLHSSTENGESNHLLQWLLSEFKSLRKCYLVMNAWRFLQHEDNAGEIHFQTHEELCALTIPKVKCFFAMQRRIGADSERFACELNHYKRKHGLSDWNIPDIQYVGATKILPLGGDRWTRSAKWRAILHG